MCRHLRVQVDIQNCFARIILHNWKNHEGRIVRLQVWLTVDVCGREIPCARQKSQSGILLHWTLKTSMGVIHVVGINEGGQAKAYMCAKRRGVGTSMYICKKPLKCIW